MKNNYFNLVMGSIQTMEAFSKTVKAVMQQYFGTGYAVEVHEVVKNNDLCLTGLVIRNESSNLAPAIYLESYYEMHQNGESLENVCAEIIRVYEANRVGTDFDITSITDFNKVKDRICYKLINAKYNEQMLADVAYIKFHDLAIVFYILVSSDADGMATTNVKTALLERWNISKAELFNIAVENTQKMFRGRVCSIEESMMELFVSQPDEEAKYVFYDLFADAEAMIPMYVCSNSEKFYGAGVMLYNGLLKAFADKIDSNFYILPSSVHEVLFVPVTVGMDIEEMKYIVRAINAVEVAEDEVLSDNIYYYNRYLDHVGLM